MSRIVRILPATRAEYSFGDLVYWHLFVYGTRPTGDPAAAAGREWDAASFCRKLNITDRTLRNWMAHRSLPDSAGEIATVWFGDNPLFDAWRAELNDALRSARLEKSRKSRSGFRSDTDHATDDAVEADASSQPGSGDDDDRPETPGTGFERDDPEDERRARSTALVPYTRGWDDETQNGRHVGAIHLAWSRRSAGHRSRAWPQRSANVLVSGLVILIGFYAWMRPSPDAPPGMPPSSSAAPNAAPVAPKPEAKNDPKEKAPIVRDTPAPSALPPLQEAKPEEKAPPKIEAARPEPPKAEPPKAETQPAPVDLKLAAERAKTADAEKLAREAAAARQRVFDAEQRARDEEARRRDTEPDPEATSARTAQDRRETDARRLADAGFRLIENNSASGSSIGHVFTETVGECALACAQEHCDAFTFPSQPRAGKNNTCHRYKAPISLTPESSARSGQRIAGVPVTQKFADAEGISTDAPRLLAQAASPSAPPAKSDPAKPDDVTRCANGVFKVSDFQLSCDRIMDGGTSLGSNALRYIVANINQCAAKCRPIARCVGFTFNAADPEGQHTCQIFGPVPVTREVGGWVSGTR